MDQQTQNSSAFHSFKESKSVSASIAFLTFFVMILLGLGAGFFFSKSKSATTTSMTSTNGSPASIVKGTIYGSSDTTTFKDTTTGTLQNGGIKGEGQFHLVRSGGDSQTVYMTSSLVDLSQFVGHKVTVWGQTQKAQTAGWLMDVGRVEVVE